MLIDSSNLDTVIADKKAILLSELDALANRTLAVQKELADFDKLSSLILNTPNLKEVLYLLSRLSN